MKELFLEDQPKQLSLDGDSEAAQEIRDIVDKFAICGDEEDGGVRAMALADYFLVDKKEFQIWQIINAKVIENNDDNVYQYSISLISLSDLRGDEETEEPASLMEEHDINNSDYFILTEAKRDEYVEKLSSEHGHPSTPFGGKKKKEVKKKTIKKRKIKKKIS